MSILGKVLSVPIFNKPLNYMWHTYRAAQLDKIREKNLKNTYAIIKKEKLDISSDFPPFDAKALEYVTRMALKNKVRIAEVGSWKGMSTAVIARTIKPYNGMVFAIDHWQGSNGVPHHEAEQEDILSIFRRNIQALDVYEEVLPMLMDSRTAASVFRPHFLDMVFIDADHRYSFVKSDIEMWTPKIRKGGIICGHDCECKYTEFGEFVKEIDAHLEEDVIVGVCHPGVVKALYDLFGSDYEIVPDSKVWWKRL